MFYAKIFLILQLIGTSKALFMKRFLLIWTLFLCSLSTVFAQFSGSGSGTFGDPYRIFYAEQLSQVRNFLNKDGVCFKLMSDIDLADWISENAPKEGWQPIGVESSPFKGVFDGNGHQISSINVERGSTDNIGLFGVVDGATIKKLTVQGKLKGRSCIGGICGKSTNTTFSDCNVVVDIQGVSNIGSLSGSNEGGQFAECVVSSTKLKGVSVSQYEETLPNSIGGIVGCNSGKLTFFKCKVEADIVGTEKMGGIIGCDNGETTLNGCQVYSHVKGNGDNIGGLVGIISSTSSESGLYQCLFNGTLVGKDNVGGLIGTGDGRTDKMKNYYKQLSISNSVAICNIDSDNGVGGLVGNVFAGSNTFDIANSYFSGTINGGTDVGGIVGRIQEKGVRRDVVSKISKCFVSGFVYGREYVGGVLGKKTWSQYSWENVNISSCASNLNVVSATAFSVGRICGSSYKVSLGTEGTSDENIALSTMIVSSQGVVQEVTDGGGNGVSKGISGLKLKANYVAHGWDFNNDWTMQETETLPYKPWQAAPPRITSEFVSKETTVRGKSIDGGTVYIEIGDVYKSSVVCSGNTWSFSVPALQAGDPVRVYAVVDGKWQSPYTDTFVGYPGSGTLADPYLIYTAADLQGVYKKGYYKLKNDVDLTEWINQNNPDEGWPAIGKNGLSAVYFDGGGHTVSGLWCNTTADYNGLFSNFPDGYIKNLTVRVAEGKEVKGGDYTGVVIGRFANGTIDNVTASGTVNGTRRSGGIVGVADKLKISSSKFDGILMSDAASAVLGGIAGEIQSGEIVKSQANSDIKASGQSTIAGALVGKNYGRVDCSFASGAVSLTGDDSCGSGLVGENESGAEIVNCYSSADAASIRYAAGLVAFNMGKVSNCYCKGRINSKLYGAGAVGYNSRTASINGIVAGNPKVEVTDKSGWSIRVLGGFAEGGVEPGQNNYALSTMILSVNGVPKKVTDNILDGYAKTEEELKSKATYEKLGWSFSRVWKIDENEGWPTLDMTVYGLVSSVTLDQKSLTLKKGQMVTLKAIVKPDDATDKTVTWSSSDTGVATVRDGIVRGVGNGKATIFATSFDGTNLSDSALVTVCAPVNDTILLKDTTAQKNKTIMYPVYLNNEDPVCSFQFDVYLPEGMDIAKNSKGKYDIQFAGRQEDTHSITSNKVSTGAVRIIAFSIANDNFSGKSGALVYLPITIGDVTKGDYDICIRNIVLADAAEKEYYCQDANGVIHVKEVIMGDANSDGKVSLADVNSTVNYIVEKPSENFCFEAADMNNNGVVNVSDVNAIVNVLAEVKSPALVKMPYNVLAAANDGTTDDRMYCDNVTVAPGNSVTLPVNLDNSGNYCSFQFDIVLPKGITIDSTVNKNGSVRYSASLVTSRCVDHSLTSNLIKGSRYRVIVFSLSNTDVEGASGPVVNIKLKAEKNVTSGDYVLKMERIVLATSDEKEFYPADNQSTVTVSTETGINGLAVDSSDEKVYDLQGRKVDKPLQGLYIINGKKVMVK